MCASLSAYLCVCVAECLCLCAYVWKRVCVCSSGCACVCPSPSVVVHVHVCPSCLRRCSVLGGCDGRVNVKFLYADRTGCTSRETERVAESSAERQTLTLTYCREHRWREHGSMHVVGRCPSRPDNIAHPRLAARRGLL